MSYLSQMHLERLVQPYGIVNFVETGCLGGGGVKAAFDAGIPLVYSCDIVKGCADAVQRAFPRAIIYAKSGVDMISEIVPKLSGPCMFWLDAHFPNMDTKVPIPAGEELKVIALKPNVDKDIIMVDDVMMMRSPLNRLPVVSPHAQDVDLSALASFRKTHAVTWWEWGTGVLVLLPLG